MIEMVRTKPSKQDRFNVLESFASALVARAALASRLGTSYSGDRDLYATLGYPKYITFDMYAARYRRQDIAKRIVNAYPDSCWRKQPDIIESASEDTDFEIAWRELIKTIPVYHYFHRADRIAGIGRYGVLLMGFDDRKTLDQPVTQAKQVTYIRPFHEGYSTVLEWDIDQNSPRYGLPKFYQLTMPNSVGVAYNVKAHYSRVIHIADGLQSDDVFGAPRLEAVYNRCQDIELISGGSAEMYWRGAMPGYAFELDKDATMGAEDKVAFQKEIEEYIHGLKRFMKLQGMKANALAPQITDPSAHLDVQINLIAAETGIPKRILIGSERGELASSQDATSWDDKVEERRENFVTPLIVRPFIDKLVTVGVLPTPKKPYAVKWPPLHVQSEKERSEIAERFANAINKYVSAIGSETILPPNVFFKKILGFDNDDITEIESLIGGTIQDEVKRIADAQAKAQADAVKQKQISDTGRTQIA